MKKTIEEINEKISKGKAAVMNAEEIIGLLEKEGINAEIFSSLATDEINVEMIAAGASEVTMYLITGERHCKPYTEGFLVQSSERFMRRCFSPYFYFILSYP